MFWIEQNTQVFSFHRKIHNFHIWLVRAFSLIKAFRNFSRLIHILRHHIDCMVFPFAFLALVLIEWRRHRKQKLHIFISRIWLDSLALDFGAAKGLVISFGITQHRRISLLKPVLSRRYWELLLMLWLLFHIIKIFPFTCWSFFILFFLTSVYWTRDDKLANCLSV